MNLANCAAISTTLFASATRPKKSLLSASATLNLTWISARQKAHGEMYMPKKLYRIRGPSKNDRHIVPVFRNIRGRTWLKLDLPVLDTYQMKKMQEESYEDFFRSRMKMYGIDPTRPTTRQTKYFLGCSNTLMDVFKPPENDGSFSQIMSSDKGVKGALKSKAEDVRSSAVSIAARRWSKALKKIKQADPTFEVETFGEKSLEIYADAHKALENRDEEHLHDLVTEYAFPNMWSELKNKTLRWEYVRSLEPPKVVHLRCGGETEDMTFGQATVRFHSQQKLAIYDQFGRLYFGDEKAVRDVLEYAVFENFLASEYGIWRLHAKILSKKSEAPPGIVSTFRKRDDQKSVNELVYKYSTKFDEKTMDDEQTQQESMADEKNAKKA